MPNALDRGGGGGTLTAPRESARPLLIIAGLYLCSRLLMVIVGVISLQHTGYSGYNYSHNLHLEGNRNTIVEIFYRWDAVWYLDIARNGYLPIETHEGYGQWSRVPFATGFFPLFPMLIRFAGMLCGSDEAAGIGLGLLLGLAVLLLLHRELADRLDDRVALAACSVLALFPPGIFLSLPYAEALLLGGFVALSRGVRLRQWEWILLGGIIATTAKPTGLFLPLILPFTIRERAKEAAWVLFSWLVGISMVIGVFVAQTGSATSFFSRQTLMRGGIDWPWAGIARFFSSEKHLFGWHGSWVDLAWFCAAFLLMIRATRHRRFDAFTLVGSWLFLLLPAVSTLTSFSRLSLAAYPVFTEAVMLRMNRAVRIAVMTVMAILLCYWFHRYATFQWLG